ncbi:MAG: cupin domain-containing protein [Bacteroidales bacterium]|jgi:quercetin dioxygenase-like cupin family protein|nr:cupin domain-containing protein [Bacteroidales bacterium]
MATILKSNEREFKERKFKEDTDRINNFRLFSDVSREKKGIKPQQLNFDLRQLHPGQYNCPYHFHRYGEELFMIISGSATLRTPAGLETDYSGDLIVIEPGETGTHLVFNHTEEPCVYLDIRTFIGFDVCEYPDSNKVNFMPMDEILALLLKNINVSLQNKNR